MTAIISTLYHLRRPQRRFALLKVVGALAALALVVGACGDDDSSDGDAASADAEADDDAGDDSGGTPGLDPEFVEMFQTQLNAVGCFAGEVDGIDGPATTAAIEAFQAAQGLTEDGVVGDETESALAAAVEAGETVCGATDTTSGGQISVSATSYDSVFTVTACDNPGETTLKLDAENETSISLAIDATDGAGTINISGGTEEDSIELSGEVTSVTVGDAGDIIVDGTFTDTGESFTATGTCA